jgi:hypothetical protein
MGTANYGGSEILESGTQNGKGRELLSLTLN